MKVLIRLLQVVFFLCAGFLLSMSAVAVEPVRIGLTPTFLNERHSLMADWKKYLERKLRQPVIFVLRDSYQETLELLRQRRIDVAWLCDCPHVTANAEFKLMATPVFNGRPFYRSYLIVPEADKTTHNILDLKNKVFAFTDPYSNVGYLVPRYELKKAGVEPDSFFRRTFFTRSQRKSIEAVAVGVADGASVNSYIWETMHQQAPVLTGRTRIADRSPDYGFPPFVAEHTFPAMQFNHLQQALFDMSSDAAGRAVLKNMNLDGFVMPKPEHYQQVIEVVRFMRNQ